MASFVFALICFVSSLTLAQVNYDSSYSNYSLLLGFSLEKSTLADIQNRLGQAEIVESGDAGEYSKSICYFFKEESTFVIFDVTEVGGGSTVHMFELETDPPDRSYELVTRQRFDEDDIGGLRLGISLPEFKSHFDSVKVDEHGSAHIAIWMKGDVKTGECGELSLELPHDITVCDVNLSISARFMQNRLISLCVFKFTTF